MQALNPTVLLDSVPYGQQGPWAVNIWMRAGNLSGSGFQYILDHGSSVAAGDVDYWGPNQVAAAPCHALAAFHA